MYKKLLVAHDGSENSQRAFNEAIKLITQFSNRNEVELFVVSVIQIVDLPEIAENQAIIDYFRKYYKEIHSNLTEVAQKENIKLTPYILVGNPSVEILNFAKDNSVDLIIVGKTGKSKIEQWLLGSVSKKILDHAPCAVLLIK
ncbi:MAG: universal stress protein [Candidatus Calescibacterium sp.]|nr:universal stress protein [Candidatus Calescibacterium sp.]MDW8132530.1 universal stress protein [Candidatus Calescibacterium sp.]